MMNLIKATLVVVAMVVMTTVNASSRDGESRRVVKIDSVGKDMIYLTYLTAESGKVSVSILDEQNSKVFSENLYPKKSFKKAYDLKDLKEGIYTIKVADPDGETVKNIVITSGKEQVKALIEAKDEAKAKVTVVGSKPVYVNFYDAHNRYIYTDVVRVEKGFSRIYDLSKVNLKSINVEVVSDGEVVTKATL